MKKKFADPTGYDETREDEGLRGYWCKCCKTWTGFGSSSFGPLTCVTSQVPDGPDTASTMSSESPELYPSALSAELESSELS